MNVLLIYSQSLFDTSY